MSRLVSLGLNGVPDTGLVGATAIELAIGAACAVALVRSTKRSRVPAPSAACIEEAA